MATQGKPYKVWSCDRMVKKSVIAASLDEFINKSKEKLDIPEGESVKVVFEGDGTEVDEDDYFQFLPFNTTLMLLRGDDRWMDQEQVEGKDEPDYMMSDGSHVSDHLRQLVTGLKREITRLITFSNDDLMEMTTLNTSSLASLLGETETYAKSVQDACQRHLDERTQTSEAMELLKLYHKAREHSPYVDDSNTKRQRLGNP